MVKKMEMEWKWKWRGRWKMERGGDEDSWAKIEIERLRNGQQTASIIFRFCFAIFLYIFSQYFFYRPSDFTVSVDAGIEPRSVASLTPADRRSNQSARSHIRPSDSTVSVEAGIEPRTVASLALAARRSITTRLDLIHNYFFCWNCFQNRNS